MRRLPIDHCPSCHTTTRTNTYCARCGVDMVDANGNARIEHTLVAREKIINWRTMPLFAFWLAVTICRPDGGWRYLGPQKVILRNIALLGVMIFIGGLVKLGRAVWSQCREGWRRSRIRSISTADPTGAVAIRGRVVTIVSAEGAEDEFVAARIVRHRETRAPSRNRIMLSSGLVGDANGVTHVTVFDASVAGRFAVVDDTGIAIVDDDALVILDRRRDARRRPIDALRDGDIVEVFGHATRESALDATVVCGIDRSFSENALVFFGDPANKVWVVLRGRHELSNERQQLLAAEHAAA